MENGQDVQIGHTHISLVRLAKETLLGHSVQPFQVTVRQQGVDEVIVLSPAILFYPQRNIMKPRTALHVGWLHDTQVVVSQISDSTYLVRVAMMPLQCYFWILGGLLALGALARSIKISCDLR